MSNEVAHSETIDKVKIEILYDEPNESPRDWENLGTMICFHSRHNLGDHEKSKDYTVESLQELIKSKEIISLPLFLYDHSGTTMSTAPFSCRWDSGQVGYIFMAKETIRKEMGRPKPTKKNPHAFTAIKHITKKDIERAYECLKQEVKTYDDYLTNNCYGWRTYDEKGNELDACWGYLGDYETSGCLEEARDNAKHYNEKMKDNFIGAGI